LITNQRYKILFETKLIAVSGNFFIVSLSNFVLLNSIY